MSDFRLAVGDLTPAIVTQLKLNCEPVDLTSASLPKFHFVGRNTGTEFTVDAEIVSPATDGKLKYQFVDGDTDVADIYDYDWSVTLADGSPITSPVSDEEEDYDYNFEIVSVPVVDSQTGLAKFNRYLRILIGDTDEDVPDYSTAKLVDALATVVAMGKLLQEDGVTPYGLSGDGKSITPKLTSTSDQYNFIRLILHAARLIVGPRTRESFSIRAFSQSIGAPEQLVQNITNDLYEVENGDGVG